jgi:hypothetical protein
VLEGQACLGPDDVDDALAKAQQRAEDLEATVTSLLDTARYAADWRTRESVLGWTEDAYRDAKGITKELRSHITLVEVRVRECERLCFFGEKRKFVPGFFDTHVVLGHALLSPLLGWLLAAPCEVYAVA